MKRKLWLEFFLLSCLGISSFCFGQSLTGKEGRTLKVLLGGLYVEEDKNPEMNLFVIQTSLEKSFRSFNQIFLIPESEWGKWKQRKTEKLQRDLEMDSLRSARKFLQEGKQYYQKLRFQEAVRSLEEARGGLIKNLHLLRSNRDLLDSHLFLGMTYAALQKNAQAKEEFRRVVYLDPSKEISQMEYSPRVIETFAKAKQEVLASSPVPLRIESTPSQAKVYLNGKIWGETPLEIQIQPGEYFVLVEKPGMEPWFRPIPIQRSREIVEATLKTNEKEEQWSHWFRTREGNEVQSQDLPPLLELANEMRADLVVLCTIKSLEEYRLLGQLLDVSTGVLSQVAVVGIQKDLRDLDSATHGLVETLLGFVSSQGQVIDFSKKSESVLRPDLTVGKDNRPVSDIHYAPAVSKKWYQKWWMYPLVVGAGVALGIGIFQIGQSSGTKILVKNTGN